MCAVGRALMARPKMILLDEPSMGLAPQIVEEIFVIVEDLNEKEGVSFLLAEQNTHMALRFARYGYILENGRVVMDGDAKSLAENEDVKEFYLESPKAGARASETSSIIGAGSGGWRNGCPTTTTPWKPVIPRCATARNARCCPRSSPAP